MLSSGPSISIQASLDTYFLIYSQFNDQQASAESDQWMDVHCS